MKNIHILSFSDRDTFIPVLWPSAKTYYEKYGQYPEKYNWVLPIAEFLDENSAKSEISKNPPDIFGVSLYVWNFEKSLRICQWVKETWPNCIVITGGPHQYFKHSKDWFKKHTFIDASVPSEVYGEVVISDMLDNLTDKGIDWNTVEKIVFPNKKRTLQLQSPKATYQLDFKWDFSAFKEQAESIQQYVEQFKIHSNATLHCKLETTRGCPYQCTFCDWGGGVGTKVIKKDIDSVKADLDVLMLQPVSSIYICDANFGINGDRDVDIIQYIADKKKIYAGKEFPNIQYGGFAKTNKHFDYLRNIFTIEAENNLSYVYKISQQSFNTQILENIKRTDLRENEHWELANYLRQTYQYEAVVELILGLPGITKDIWYTEFNKPYSEGVLVRAYEWHLLPEAESYDDAYRNKFGLQTAKKSYSNDAWSIPAEIVVASNSYTRTDYKDMMAIYAIYFFFEQSGVYRKTIKRLGIPFGEFLKQFYNDCYPKLLLHSSSLQHLDDHLTTFVKDEINTIQLSIAWNNNTDYTILVWSYLILEYFKNFEDLDPIVNTWLQSIGADTKLCEQDSKLIHSEKRMNTVNRSLFSKIQYNNFKDIRDLLYDLNGTYQYYYGNILGASTTLF
jgi:putative methyltransferase